MYSSRFIATLLLAPLLPSTFAVLTPENVEITASFPLENQFGVVFNGQPNKIILKLQNHGKDPVADVLRIHSVWNEFRELGGKEKLLRKGNPTPSKRTLPPNPQPYTLPYYFSAEQREGNLNLKIWVEWSPVNSRKKERTLAYDSTVTITEPPTRWFDPQLILLYIIFASLAAGIGYMAYGSYLTTPVGRKSAGVNAKVRDTVDLIKNSPKVSTPTGGKYEADWIPSNHQQRPGSYKVASSGAESAGEDNQSGTESKARRRKR
ncbi:hypothetical protein CROQUDRAFT_653801 [Cronartium quercuum f. sp. fusiforme G11]|uniref:Signal sequence receptor subunit alpha n=1 Tax=Cronartium quercuum f. sp. fusiforme G11 TaxID=708437 RepID=A0A9P6NTH8_9BASI|nr:hypothetical protein CROQUDRAFT_653801 [Cronartium quercuum f. sp. fusiforme G11]